MGVVEVGNAMLCEFHFIGTKCQIENVDWLYIFEEVVG
jgi:hypothetical protein